MIDSESWKTATVDQLQKITWTVTYKNGSRFIGPLTTEADRIVPVLMDKEGEPFESGLDVATRGVSPRLDETVESITCEWEDDDEGDEDDFERTEDPDYYRMGDIAVTRSGNRYTIVGFHDGGGTLIPRLQVIENIVMPERDASGEFYTPLDDIDHCLRRNKPGKRGRMPDQPGLWESRIGELYYVFPDRSMVCIRDSSGQWLYPGTPMPIDSDVTGAPFHPYRSKEETE